MCVCVCVAYLRVSLEVILLNRLAVALERPCAGSEASWLSVGEVGGGP